MSEEQELPCFISVSNADLLIPVEKKIAADLLFATLERDKMPHETSDFISRDDCLPESKSDESACSFANADDSCPADEAWVWRCQAKLDGLSKRRSFIWETDVAVVAFLPMFCYFACLL